MKLSGCNRPNRMNMKRISRISFFIYIALLAITLAGCTTEAE